MRSRSSSMRRQPEVDVVDLEQHRGHARIDGQPAQAAHEREEGAIVVEAVQADAGDEGGRRERRAPLGRRRGRAPRRSRSTQSPPPGDIDVAAHRAAEVAEVERQAEADAAGGAASGSRARCRRDQLPLRVQPASRRSRVTDSRARETSSRQASASACATPSASSNRSVPSGRSASSAFQSRGSESTAAAAPRPRR